MLHELSLLYHEIKDFKQLYFPKGYKSNVLQRVEIDKATALVTEDENLRANVQRYLHEQASMVKSLEKLFKFRIKFLKLYFTNFQRVSASNRKSAGSRQQLVLFPEESPNTLLCWNGQKVDFVELFYAVFESGLIGMLGEGKPNRDAFFELLQWFFNFKFDNVGPLIRSAKKRKKENTPFLLKLIGIFKGTSSLEL